MFRRKEAALGYELREKFRLAVLLHRLWVTGEVYEPLRNSQAKGLKAA